MQEEYKTCPYCHNMVDKKDKECPYCLKSLSWRNSAWSYNHNTRNNSIDSNTEDYNIDNYNTDTIRDDKQAKKNWELPEIFQKFLDFQKQINWWKKINDSNTVKKIRKFIIIFFLVTRGIPMIIELISELIWD